MNIVSNEIADEVREISSCATHSILVRPTKCGLVVFSIASVCLSVCSALTFESLDLEVESSVLVCRCVFKLSRSYSYVKVIGSRSRSQKQKMHRYGLFGI